MSEFVMILLFYPIIVVVGSVVGSLLWKKWFVMPFVTIVAFTILALIAFNHTFFVWIGMYTVLSAVVSWTTVKIQSMT